MRSVTFLNASGALPVGSGIFVFPFQAVWSSVEGCVGSRSPSLPSHGRPFGFAVSGDEKEMPFVHGREGGTGAGKTAMAHEQ